MTEHFQNKAIPSTGSNSLLIVVISIFFFWGFAASGNALLIPAFKTSFNLSQFQAQLVEWAFYIAYFTGSLIFFILSIVKNEWMGYMSDKRGMITGLIISSIGSLMLIAATFVHSYAFFLFSFFTIAFGFTLQQIVANPLLILLGSHETGAHRLILAGSINSFGNTIAPLILSSFLFGSLYSSQETALSLSSIRMPYLILSGLYLLFAFWVYRTAFPASTSTTTEPIKDLGALTYPQLLYGMLGIFCYVGAEVTMQSNLPAFIESDQVLGLPPDKAIHYMSLFGGSLMIGRWTGAIFNFKLSKTIQNTLLLVVPILAFVVVLLVNALKGSPLSDIVDYLFFLPVLTITLLISRQEAHRILLYSSISAVIMLAFGQIAVGKYALYCITSAALFSALMWPCIFPLAIKNLGKYTNQGSSLLIMMILGGAIIPPMQGLMADQPGIGIKLSYLLPLCCYGYLIWYANKVRRILLLE